MEVVGCPSRPNKTDLSVSLTFYVAAMYALFQRHWIGSRGGDPGVAAVRLLPILVPIGRLRVPLRAATARESAQHP
jgi:hypothetical protein